MYELSQLKAYPNRVTIPLTDAEAHVTFYVAAREQQGRPLYQIKEQ